MLYQLARRTRTKIVLGTKIPQHMTFSTLVLKPFFCRSLSLHANYPLFALISWNLTTRCLAVTGGGSVGE